MIPFGLSAYRGSRSEEVILFYIFQRAEGISLLCQICKRPGQHRAGIPIGFVQIFGIGKPFFGYFERLASHDWVLRMTSSLRKKLYSSLEQEGIVSSGSVKMGEALGLLSEDISHVQNLYLRTVFPLLTAWIMGGMVVIAMGVMSVPCAVMLLVGFIVIAVLLPLQALLVNGARAARVKALRA